jgi:formylglycine-generating enzyme required for sulfatase activity
MVAAAIAVTPTWRLSARLRELHARALASLPRLIRLKGGKGIKLGRPPEAIEAAKRAHPKWPTEILDRQAQRTADIDGLEMGETEVTWPPYCDYLNELLLRKLITLGRDSQTQKIRYVFRLDGVLLIDLDPTKSGIEYDEEKDEFKLVGSTAIWKPVEMITWDGANDFCPYYGLRLPTSNEWEYAAREESDRLYSNGRDTLACEDAVIAREQSRNPLNPATQQCTYLHSPGAQDVRESLNDETNLNDPKNPVRIKGLIGNVSEWVADKCQMPANWVSANPSAEAREYRGGNYDTDMERGQASFRSCLPRLEAEKIYDWAKKGVGVRCVR